MDQAQFEQQYHWLYGLDEYYKFTGQEEKWSVLSKALMQNNFFRIRDVILKMMDISADGDNKKTVEYLYNRGWLNVLLRSQLEGVTIKEQNVTNLIRAYMADGFSDRVARFVNYWGGDSSEAAVMPDMNDFLSRGQVKSKLWLVTELAKIVEGSLGNVVFYGGWYNFTAHFIFDQFEVNKIYSLDVDGDVIEPSKRFYTQEVIDERFLPKSVNVNKVTWRDDGVWVPADDGTEWQLSDQLNLVVNTSCEHMDGTWYDNLPSGTMVLLQTNDYFDNPQHSNCCKDLEDVKNKYPMQSIMYAGELDTHLYNRFMLIGIK